MPGTPFVVLADSPDDSQAAVVGPVYSERAALTLATEIAAAGWKPTGVRPYLSRAAFRNYVAAGKSEAATAAGEGN
jgi:hypothetical protein